MKRITWEEIRWLASQQSGVVANNAAADAGRLEIWTEAVGVLERMLEA